MTCKPSEQKGMTFYREYQMSIEGRDTRETPAYGIDATA